MSHFVKISLRRRQAKTVWEGASIHKYTKCLIVSLEKESDGLQFWEKAEFLKILINSFSKFNEIQLFLLILIDSFSKFIKFWERAKYL